MLVHAAFGGSTNLLIHIPAIAHAAGLRRPTVEDWRSDQPGRAPTRRRAPERAARTTSTVRVFLAGGVPEVMLHLRRLGLLHVGAMTVTGRTWDDLLDEWEGSERRARLRARLVEADGVDPDDVISPARAGAREGHDLDRLLPGGQPRTRRERDQEHRDRPARLDEDGIYRLTGPARVFTSERDVIAAIKGTSGEPDRARAT